MPEITNCRLKNYIPIYLCTVTEGRKGGREGGTGGEGEWKPSKHHNFHDLENRDSSNWEYDYNIYIIMILEIYYIIILSVYNPTSITIYDITITIYYIYKHQAILKGTHFTDEETDGERGCNLNKITQVVSSCSQILWFSDWATPKETPTSFYSRKYKPSPPATHFLVMAAPRFLLPIPLKGHVRPLKSFWGNGALHLMTVFGFASKKRVKSPVRGSVLGPVLTGIFPLVWEVPLHGEAWARGSSMIPILLPHSSRTSRSIKETLEFRSHPWEIQYMIARHGPLPRRLLPTPSCLSSPLSFPHSSSTRLTCLSDSHSVRVNSADSTI